MEWFLYHNGLRHERVKLRSLMQFEDRKAKSNDVPRVTVGNPKLKLFLDKYCFRLFVDIGEIIY